MSISPDDPRLTDYALSEMEAAKAKEFEAEISENPSAFDEVHEIRGAVSTLGDAIATKPVRSLTDTQRHRILRLADAPAPQSLASHRENILRPAFWGWFGKFTAGAAAAAIAVTSLIFAYQRGYQKAVDESLTKHTTKGTVSTGDALPGETPSIRITILDPEGESQPVATRPLSHHAVLPVSEGSEDALVSAVPKVHLEPGSEELGSSAKSKDEPKDDPVPDSRLPIAAVGSPGKNGVLPTSVMENPFVEVSTSPRSSFPLRSAADAYTIAAGAIRGTNQLPDPATIAVEEIVNAFSYAVPGFIPTSSHAHPFAAGAEVFSCPWNPVHRLVRVTVATFGTAENSASGPVAIAEDIELLVEFNRSRAARYRLIGFEGAGLLSAVTGSSPKARTLFSGDTVTALYEVVPAKGAKPGDDFRYAPHNYAAPTRDRRRELLCLSLSYRLPSKVTAEDPVKVAPVSELVFPVIDPGLAWNRSSDDFQFAAAAAAFGMVLSGSEHAGEFGFDQIHSLAERALRDQKNPESRRADFLQLVREASRLSQK